MKKFLTAFLLVGMLFVPGVSSALDASDIAFQYWGGNDKIMEQEYETIRAFVYAYGSKNTTSESTWSWFIRQMNESHKKYGVITITKEQLVRACIGLFNEEYVAEKKGRDIYMFTFNQKCTGLKNRFNTMWRNGLLRKEQANKTNEILCQKAGCPVTDNDLWTFEIDDLRNEGVAWGKCITFVPGEGVYEDNLSELHCDGRIKWYDNKYQEVKSEERCREVLVKNFFGSKSGINSQLINMHRSVWYNFGFDKRDVTCSGNDKCVVSIPVDNKNNRAKGYYSACLKINLSACDDLRADLFIGTEVTRTKEMVRETPMTLLECEQRTE